MAAVNNSDFDYLVTTPEYDQDDPEDVTVPIERDWLSVATGAARRVGGTELVEVWELSGQIDPSICGRISTS